MVEALAPRVSRCWLAVVFFAAYTSFAAAQDDAKKAETDKEAAAAAEAEKEGIIDKGQMEKQETSEVFEDPRAKALLSNTFKEFPDTKPKLMGSDFSALRNMSANVVGVNPGLISRFLDQMAADLSKHDYIKAVLELDAKGPPGARARAIEEASQRLLEYINTAHDKKSQAFLQTFVPMLFTKFTPLLEGHLYSRIEAIIVLATAADVPHAEVFVKQIADPKQVVWVKHWSAIGLTNLTDRGKVTLGVNEAVEATSKLLGFLEKEPATPWPVKLRVLQALGSIRLASTAGVTGKPDVAAYAATLLVDPTTKPDLRAWAAWCLGMVNIPGGQPFNYKLVAYQLGRLAADLGDKMLADYAQRGDKFARQSDYTRHLTGLLLYQVYPALAGEDGVQGSGLLHVLASRGNGRAGPFMMGLDTELKKFGRAANDLLTAGGNQVKQARNDLAAQLVELKSFLDKNRPAANEWELFPDGPSFAPAPRNAPAPARRPAGG